MNIARPGNRKVTKKQALQRVKNSEIPSGNGFLVINPENSPHVSVSQAVKDFRREKVVFNGIPFVPHTVNQYRGDMFIKTLYEYAALMVKLNSKSCAETFQCESSIGDLIMQNSCRTSAGADSYFILQDLFNIDGTILSQRTEQHNDPPIIIDLLMNSDSLQSIIKVWNSFSIYDTTEIETKTDLGLDPVPWLEIDTQIVDEYDFKSCQHSRQMKLIVYSPQKQKYYFSRSSGERSIHHLPQCIASKRRFKVSPQWNLFSLFTRSASGSQVGGNTQSFIRKSPANLKDDDGTDGTDTSHTTFRMMSWPR